MLRQQEPWKIGAQYCGGPNRGNLCGKRHREEYYFQSCRNDQDDQEEIFWAGEIACLWDPGQAEHEN